MHFFKFTSSAFINVLFICIFNVILDKLHMEVIPLSTSKIKERIRRVDVGSLSSKGLKVAQIAA